MVGADGAAGAAGAADAAAAAELQATQWRLRWRTGDVARRRRWRTGAGGHRGSRRTSSEPAAGVMDRRRSGQRSDSESRSLHTAGLGQPAGPRHSPAPTGVRRGTSDGHGLDRIEGGGDNGKPSRTGRHPRVAVTGVSICSVGALVKTPGT